MDVRTNSHGQPIGVDLEGWSPPIKPPMTKLVGRTCVLEPLSLKHVRQIYEADLLDPSGQHWTYKSVGPFESEQDFAVWVAKVSAWDDYLFYTVIERTSNRAVGIASYLRVVPEHGCAEIGAIYYSPLLQRTTAATEAMFLMLSNLFGLGYRRCEWKCDRFNEPSRRAALRLGFQFEGTFRDAAIYKGRSRDTDWFAMTTHDWPAVQARLQDWLDPNNFDERGHQLRSLQDI